MPEVLTTAGTFIVAYLGPGFGPVAYLIGGALIVVGTVWGGDEAKRKQKDQEDAARRSYNSSLQDRTATVISSESPHRYIYGRARVGSSIVAVLTSGGRDEYKHLVCVHAAHECDAFEEIYINGNALGTLDGNGYVTGGDYFQNTILSGFDRFTGTGRTLSNTPISGTLRVLRLSDNAYIEPSLYTLTGDIISGLPSDGYDAIYEYASSNSYVRVLKHLGESGQIADATLISEVPTKWDSTKTLSGLCYTIITINLNFPDFQGGVPSVEALIRGKKLHDVRDGAYPNDTPVWSQNNALMIADYLTSEMCSVPWTDLPLADFIAAANVCDETNVYGTNYTANGTVTADESQSLVLEKMAQSMAGSTCSETWGIKAGKYVAPAMSLDQSDIVGSMSYTAGVAESDLYNGVKGQYIDAANLYVPTDFEPYQNSNYVTADGGELWTDVNFMFTDDKQRVHNICRIFTEDQRNGFTIEAEFSYKTLALQVGDRVEFTSTFMGQTSKVYRVVKKSYAINSSVNLTLKEDAASIWDLADAVTVDSTPNTDFPNPLILPVPFNITVSDELYETSGSAGLKVKAIVEWDEPNDANVSDYEITYKSFSDPYFNLTVYSVSPYVEILDIAEGRYDIKIRAHNNNLNIYSDYTTIKTFEVYGFSLPPENVSNFTVTPFNGMALCKWDRTTSLDVKIGGDVEIRFCPLTTGASWEQSVILPDGTNNGDATTALVSLATGTYYISFVDSTGNNYSPVPASFIATEALVTGWTTVQTSTQHTLFSGVKTNCVATDGILKLDSVSLFDDIADFDSVGYLDSIGGISSIGVYEFDSVMDLTTVSSRRFHAHIKSLSYNAADLMDDRLDLMDSWSDFDGGIINDTNATVYASYSDDNITYSSWAPFMVADFSCRYIKFKLELISGNSTHNIDISELTVTAKIPT